MSVVTQTASLIRFTKRGLFGVCALALVVGLSSCGRRGPLELPPSEVITTTDENGKKVKKKKPQEDKPFILDPLL